MKIYTLITGEYDYFTGSGLNLGDCGFRLNPDFQDVITYWVNQGEDEQEMQSAINDCIEEIDLDNKEECKDALSHRALMFTSVPVLKQMQVALKSHGLSDMSDFIARREKQCVSDFNPKEKPRYYLNSYSI